MCNIYIYILCTHYIAVCVEDATVFLKLIIKLAFKSLVKISISNNFDQITWQDSTGNGFKCIHAYKHNTHTHTRLRIHLYIHAHHFLYTFEFNHDSFKKFSGRKYFRLLSMFHHCACVCVLVFLCLCVHVLMYLSVCLYVCIC